MKYKRHTAIIVVIETPPSKKKEKKEKKEDFTVILRRTLSCLGMKTRGGTKSLDLTE